MLILQGFFKRVGTSGDGGKLVSGGGGGIRTRESLTTLPVFKTGAINRSATPPWNIF